MHYPHYTFAYEPDTEEYHFESIGSKGIIHKIVIFSMAVPEFNIFNLGLVDYNPETGSMSDTSVSDNDDLNKILATIFQISVDYTRRKPNHLVAFQGTTPPRNRLYRMAINHAFEDISQIFDVYGFYKDEWEFFTPNKSYDLFLIKLK